MSIKTIEQLVGNTPLVILQKLNSTHNRILLKLEGNNPAGSVKDRPALNMIKQAALRGDIKPGDTLIEATSGNTGIALAMAAAMMGYKIYLVMPDSMSEERRASMKAYGAELVLVPKAGGMLQAIDKAREMQAGGLGTILDQFSNQDNLMAHYNSTGPEIWRDTNGEVTHFVSAMGTTGTIMGVSKFLKQQNDVIQIVGVQPASAEEAIPGIRKWPKEYIPKIYDSSRVDEIIDMTQDKAEHFTRLLARQEGIFSGISAGGAVAASLELAERVDNATIVTIIPDRGDRYLSTGVFSD